MKKIILLGLLLGAVSFMPVLPVNAATDNQAMEFTKLQRPSEAIGSLGNDLFGEKTDFYTDSTSCSCGEFI